MDPRLYQQPPQNPNQSIISPPSNHYTYPQYQPRAPTQIGYTPNCSFNVYTSFNYTTNPSQTSYHNHGITPFFPHPQHNCIHPSNHMIHNLHSTSAAPQMVTSNCRNNAQTQPNMYHDILSKIFNEPSLDQRPLAVVCKQRNNGWNELIDDRLRRSFGGYKRNPFTDTELTKWWHELTTSEDIKWNRPHGFPRKCAWFVSNDCKCCYRYSSTLWAPNVFPNWFNQITKRVLDETGLIFENAPNSCNVNWYKDGSDSVGWHSDDEGLFNSIYDDALILSLSLGIHRRFEIKLTENIDGDADGIKEIVLYNGDLMSMEGKCQRYYEHRVPKEYGVNGARINLTWRWIKKHCRRRDRCNAISTGPGNVTKCMTK